MSRVLILGAGECGLPLAYRLSRHGVDVTLVTNRDVDAILAGGVTSTQVKFAPTLALEFNAGLSRWRSIAPEINGIRFVTVQDRKPVMQWVGRLHRPAQSVDQRTVFAQWLTDVADAGATLHIAAPDLSEIDRLARGHDMTIATRVTGELAGCFSPDPAWASPQTPQRRLAVLYLFGVPADPDGFGTYAVLPGHGEVISYPGLTGAPGNEYPCEIVLFEAIPGGCLDVFASVFTLEERLAQAVRLLAVYLPPDFAEYYTDAELTDSGATLVGGVTPVMRTPIGSLPSGTTILGGGDVVCRMDPGGAQGANSASHCAAYYADSILRNNCRPLDKTGMIAAAARWLTRIAHPAARWTTALLDPPPRLRQLVGAAQDNPALGDAFANTFARPVGITDLLGQLNQDHSD